MAVEAAPELHATTSQGNITVSGYEIDYVRATFTLPAGPTTTTTTPLRIVISLADNLQGDSDDDPSAAATALAAGASADAVAAASRPFSAARSRAVSSLDLFPVDLWLAENV